MLACGSSDGSVAILTLRQTLNPKPTHTKFVPDHGLSLSVQLNDEKACESDGRAITGLQWVKPPGRSVSLLKRSSWKTFAASSTLIYRRF